MSDIFQVRPADGIKLIIEICQIVERNGEKDSQKSSDEIVELIKKDGANIFAGIQFMSDLLAALIELTKESVQPFINELEEELNITPKKEFIS